jgi:hypothetical protein
MSRRLNPLCGRTKQFAKVEEVGGDGNDSTKVMAEDGVNDRN